MAQPVMATVPKLWPNATIVCLGTGPSLTSDDVNWCRGRAPIIAVNDAYKLAPFADVLYACDAKWWQSHQGVPSFTGLKFSIEARSGKWAQILRNTGRDGLELNPTGLRTGKNSGAQAIGLAVHLGAKRIILLGYDLGTHGGMTHFFGDHPQPLSNHSPFPAMIACFQTMVAPLKAHGVEVVNCSRRTALTCFKRQSLREALPELFVSTPTFEFYPGVGVPL